MALFPESITIGYGFSFSPEFKTLQAGPTDGDRIHRRKKRTVPLHKLVIPFDAISREHMVQVLDFFQARYGSWESFAVYNGHIFTHNNVIIGTGDGLEYVFDVLGKETTGLVITVDDVVQVEGVDYELYAGQGTDGQDMITFSSAGTPEDGAVIKASFTGRRYFSNCIFNSDIITIGATPGFRDGNMCFKSGVEIVEVSS